PRETSSGPYPSELNFNEVPRESIAVIDLSAPTHNITFDAIAFTSLRRPVVSSDCRQLRRNPLGHATP
ncbi:MAG: hypothetical protein VYA90_03075, partial [Acidobacteriota bacterium]|nr:hypothetical protein [Acidobacteriota bacterium]